MIKYIPIFLAAFLCAPTLNAKELTLLSPDGRNKVTFSKPDKELTYTVAVDGKEVILPSRAGLDVDNWAWEMALGKRDLNQPECWMDPFSVDSVSYRRQVDNTWHPLYGERSTVADRYNSATLHMSRKDKSDYRLDVEVRAYDEGIAFRYFFPEHPTAIFHKVVADLTDYSFPEGTMAWSEKWAQSAFDYTPVDSISRPVERALTLELPDGKWVALLDADVDDWCLTKYTARKDRPGTLSSVMYSPVDIVTYYATPWKIIMTADTPGQLIENNDIVLNLNPHSEGDFSWVKPGKIMRCTKISTEAGLANIDFCAEHNIPYMLFDAGWYLPCTSHDGDATKVVDKLDMKRVIEHGKEKGVGLWLYVNQHALMKQMDELFPLLKEWPDATHNVTLPFTRMVNGPADYTICYYDKRLKNTHAHQLAASIVFYSPLMTILWYDTPSLYGGEPEIKWFEDLQTSFDDSRVLSGYPGKSIVMARRHADDWFVGAMTNNDGSRETVDLSFLQPGTKYIAEVYTDGGEEIKTKTQVKCTKWLVDSEDVITFDLKPRGGAAVRIAPADGNGHKGVKKYKKQIL